MSEDRIQRSLNAPYHRIFFKENDGGYSSLVLELPGVFGGGDTIEESNQTLEYAMEDWIALELEKGHDIPEPIDPESFSGTLTLRIPPSLHYSAQLRAQLEGVSLNRLLSDAISRYVGDLPRQERYPSAQPDIRGVAESP